MSLQLLFEKIINLRGMRFQRENRSPKKVNVINETIEFSGLIFLVVNALIQ